MFKDDISGAVGMVILIFLALTLGDQIKGSSKAEAEEKQIAEVIPGALKSWVQDREERKCKSSGFPYKTVEAAYNGGIKWGKGKKLIKKMKKMYELWYPYYWKYGGGRDPAWLAFLTLTETAHTGNPFSCTKDTHLGECGLLSVKRAISEKYNGQCCDPPMNIWMASKAAHEKREKIDERYKDMRFYKKMDYADRYLFYALLNKYPCFKTRSNAIVNASVAKKYPGNHPWFVAASWIQKMGQGLHEPKYAYCWGRNSPEVAVFRFARAKGMRDLMIRVYGGGKKGRKQWAKCIRPVSLLDEEPESNTGYPGKKLHGHCCDNWAPSSHGKSCFSKWQKPPMHQYKKKKKGLKNLWSDWCVGDDCTYTTVFDNWKFIKQQEGILPSAESYLTVKREMQDMGCWIGKD